MAVSEKREPVKYDLEDDQDAVLQHLEDHWCKSMDDDFTRSGRGARIRGQAELSQLSSARSVYRRGTPVWVNISVIERRSDIKYNASVGKAKLFLNEETGDKLIFGRVTDTYFPDQRLGMSPYGEAPLVEVHTPSGFRVSVPYSDSDWLRCDEYIGRELTEEMKQILLVLEDEALEKEVIYGNYFSIEDLDPLRILLI